MHRRYYPDRSNSRQKGTRGNGLSRQYKLMFSPRGELLNSSKHWIKLPKKGVISSASLMGSIGFFFGKEGLIWPWPWGRTCMARVTVKSYSGNDPWLQTSCGLFPSSPHHSHSLCKNRPFSRGYSQDHSHYISNGPMGKGSSLLSLPTLPGLHLSQPFIRSVMNG